MKQKHTKYTCTPKPAKGPWGALSWGVGKAQPTNDSVYISA